MCVCVCVSRAGSLLSRAGSLLFFLFLSRALENSVHYLASVGYNLKAMFEDQKASERAKGRR